jgi:septal ring factor EnvC (AmiA/AmiB activator)
MLPTVKPRTRALIAGEETFMRMWTHVARAVRLGAILLMATVTGCTISIQPWTKPQPPPPQPSFPDSNPLNPNMMMKNGAQQRNSSANNEETAQLIKQFNDEQDLRKSLQDQVASLQKQLKNREMAMQATAVEVDETTKQIKQTRAEFRQWQSEMEELRDRIRKLEEYRSSAKPLIEDIYRFLDRDKEPAKMFRSK